jgi:hypothetical protein
MYCINLCKKIVCKDDNSEDVYFWKSFNYKYLEYSVINIIFMYYVLY